MKKKIIVSAMLAAVSVFYAGDARAQTWNKIGLTSPLTDGAKVPSIGFDTTGKLFVDSN